jgi:hypothetical protein
MIMVVYIRFGGNLQGAAEFGQFNAMVRAVKQGHVENIFKLFDTFTQTLL